MTTEDKTKTMRPGLLARLKPSGSRIPANHVLYERLLPVSIIFMTIIMGGLILFAAGVLLGLIPFN